jgi:hypothetical protein
MKYQCTSLLELNSTQQNSLNTIFHSTTVSESGAHDRVTVRCDVVIVMFDGLGGLVDDNTILMCYIADRTGVA